ARLASVPAAVAVAIVEDGPSNRAANVEVKEIDVGKIAVSVDVVQRGPSLKRNDFPVVADHRRIQARRARVAADWLRWAALADERCCSGDQVADVQIIAAEACPIAVNKTGDQVSGSAGKHRQATIGAKR